MKRKVKALLSILLTLVLLFGTTCVAFAKEDVTPVIVVHGMGSSPLYKDAGTAKQKKVPEISLSTFTDGDDSVINMILDAAKGNVKDPEKFINKIAKVMQSFTDIACDKNGNSLYNVTNTNYWTDPMTNHKKWLNSKVSNEPAITKQICEKIGYNNVYCFNYDWRLDFCENAEKLNNLVDEVKKQKSCDKVTIIGGSEGTCVVAAYVDKYMDKNDLERVIYLDGAITGVSVGNAFAMDLFFDGDFLSNYVKSIAYSYNNRTLNLRNLQFVGPVLNGSLKNACTLLNKVKKDKKLLNKFYNEALYPVFGNIPALWGFITYDSFDKAVSKMSSIGFLDKNSGLYTKITNYHKIQGRAKSNIKKLQAKGVDVVVVANYNTQAVPITSERNNHSDILIDTKYASVGATVADFGKTLPAKKTKNNKYASADKIIDASTCAAKDSTWFVKDIQHMDFWYGSGACDFLATLVTTKTKPTIKNISAITGVGQFVATDRNQNVITQNAPSVTLTAKKGSITYKTGAVKGATGYEIQYSVDKKFNVRTTTKNVTSASSGKISADKKKNKYMYVRARAYKVVKGVKTYSEYTTKKIKIK